LISPGWQIDVLENKGNTVEETTPENSKCLLHNISIEISVNYRAILAIIIVVSRAIYVNLCRNRGVHFKIFAFSQCFNPSTINFKRQFCPKYCGMTQKDFFTHLTRGGFLYCVPEDLGFLSADITSLVKQYCNSNNVKE